MNQVINLSDLSLEIFMEFYISKNAEILTSTFSINMLLRDFEVLYCLDCVLCETFDCINFHRETGNWDYLNPGVLVLVYMDIGIMVLVQYHHLILLYVP